VGFLIISYGAVEDEMLNLVVAIIGDMRLSITNGGAVGMTTVSHGHALPAALPYRRRPLEVRVGVISHPSAFPFSFSSKRYGECCQLSFQHSPPPNNFWCILTLKLHTLSAMNSKLNNTN